MVRELLGPLLRLSRPSHTGWRIVGWDADAGVSITLAKEPHLVLIEVEPREDARPCFARTKRFNVCARPVFGQDAALTDEERRIVEQVVGLLRAREGMLAVAEERPSSDRADVREVTVESVLVAEGAGHFHINPYTGCLIGCAFCYAARRAELSRELDARAVVPWGRYVDVKINAAAVLRREVTLHAPGIVRISPIVTDPYQPIERRYRITRQCLEVLGEARFVPIILTRAARVVEDIELLARIPGAAVGLSIPTDDDAVRRAFEPGADSIEARFDALERCHAAGVTTFAVIQPILAMDPDRLVARVAPFVRAVRIDRMHEMDRAAPLYARAGRLDACEDAFFERTTARLLEGFASRGVPVDTTDDLGSLVAMSRAPAPGA